MRFRRNVGMLRSQLDAAPVAAVFFSLVIFLMLGSLVYTPGVQIRLPLAEGLAGTDKPRVAVAIDSGGLLYYQNHLIAENELRNRLRKAVKDSAEPLALIVQADKDVSEEKIIRIAQLAQQVGIAEALLATLPRSVAVPPPAAQPGPP